MWWIMSWLFWKGVRREIDYHDDKADLRTLAIVQAINPNLYERMFDERTALQHEPEMEKRAVRIRAGILAAAIFASILGVSAISTIADALGH